MLRGKSDWGLLKQPQQNQLYVWVERKLSIDEQKWFNFTIEVPGGHLLLNAHMFFACHIIAREDFFFVLAGPACFCPRGFQSVSWTPVFFFPTVREHWRLCWWPLTLPLSLWASLPLFPCNSNMLHTRLRWKLLQRQARSGSICCLIWAVCRVGSATPQRWRRPWLPAAFAEVQLQTCPPLGRLRPAFSPPWAFTFSWCICLMSTLLCSPHTTGRPVMPSQNLLAPITTGYAPHSRACWWNCSCFSQDGAWHENVLALHSQGTPKKKFKGHSWRLLSPQVWCLRLTKWLIFINFKNSQHHQQFLSFLRTMSLFVAGMCP